MADINKQNEELISVPDMEMEIVNGGATNWTDIPPRYAVGQTVYYIHYTNPYVVTEIDPYPARSCWGYTLKDDWSTRMWVEESQISEYPRPDYAIKK